MAALQRFQTIMSVFFLLCAAVSLWRIVACDGRDIWYVPCVLVCTAGIMAAGARNARRKKGQNND